MGTSHLGIGPSCIVLVRTIVRIAYRAVKPSIGSVVDQTESYRGSGEKRVEGSVHIMSVVHIYETGMVIIESPVVIKDNHAAYSTYAIATIVDVHVPDLGNTTVIVIKNGYVFDLYHRTIIIILCVRAIIVSGVKGHPVSTTAYIIVDIKIELPIRIYREGNTVLHKNKGVVITIGSCFKSLILGCGLGEHT